LGNSFGKQFRGTALGSSFGKLSGTSLRNNCFEEQQLWEQLSGAAFQFRGAAFSSNFRGQLSGASLQNSFGEPFWGIGLKNRSFAAIALDSSFGEPLLVATLGRSFWEPLCRMALGSRFGD